MGIKFLFSIREQGQGSSPSGPWDDKSHRVTPSISVLIVWANPRGCILQEAPTCFQERGPGPRPSLNVLRKHFLNSPVNLAHQVQSPPLTRPGTHNSKWDNLDVFSYKPQAFLCTHWLILPLNISLEFPGCQMLCPVAEETYLPAEAQEARSKETILAVTADAR